MSDEKDKVKDFDLPFEENPLGEVFEEVHPDDAGDRATLYSPLEEILSVDFESQVAMTVEAGCDAEPMIAEPVSEEPLGEEAAYPPAESEMPFEFLYEEQAAAGEAPPEYLQVEGAFEASLRVPAEVEPEEAQYEAVYEEPKPEPERLEEVISAIDDQLQSGLEEAASVSVEPARTQRLKAQQKYVIFSLADARYAVPLKNVIEIGHRPRTTALPHVPEWLVGVTNRRGEILSVVDLKAFLGITEMNSSLPGRMLVVRTTNDEMTVGLIVDQVNKILDLPADQVQTPTAPVEMKLAPYMLGVCEYRSEFLAVLDLEPILLSSEMRQFEPV